MLIVVGCSLGSYAQNSFFVSGGNAGIGVGKKIQSYSIFMRYYYEYYDDPSFYVYYHYPSIYVTKDIYQSDMGSIYFGAGFTQRVYKQKYFFSGTYNTTDYFINVPIGVEIKPFKKLDNLSVLVESGIEFEHTSSFQLAYDWQLNLKRAVVDIRYEFNSRSRKKTLSKN